jgi:Mycothiol maleylpyruvate isomerase N-terminal domain
MTRQAGETAAALADAAGRTAQLLRSGLDPAARVPGLTWNAAETAAHLVTDLREHTAILTGTHHAPGTAGGPGDGRNAAERGAAANRAQLGAFPERDLTVLAGLIEEAAAAFNTALTARPGREPVVTANSVPMGPVTLASVLLGEQLIHGLDLARSAGRPWPIARGDALRVIPGIMAVAGDYLDPDAACGLHVCYELRFGPSDRYRFVVDGPTATASPAEGTHGRPDCVITADPVAFLLLGYGRAGQWSQILRGKLRAGGRRPWLAQRFSSLLTCP